MMKRRMLAVCIVIGSPRMWRKRKECVVFGPGNGFWYAGTRDSYRSVIVRTTAVFDRRDFSRASYEHGISGGTGNKTCGRVFADLQNSV